MDLANLTLISSQRSVKASNLNIESLSVDRTSSVRFLDNSVRKSFTIVSLPQKNKSKAPKKSTDTRPINFAQKKFEKGSFRFSFPPRCLEQFPCRTQIDVLLYRAIYRLCSKTLQRNQNSSVALWASLTVKRSFPFARKLFSI